jgi:glycosyltransferase involved in cell wall biosynthesis
MRLSLFLPHVGVYGGVRRFLQLGNAWAASGHEVTLFHPTGEAPAWLPFRGAVRPLADSGGRPADLAWCADPHTFEAFERSPAQRHFYYCVIERDAGLARALANPAITLVANSSPLRTRVQRRARRPVLDGIGGIDLARFRPEPGRRTPGLIRILVNGRRSRPKKGTDLVLAALRGLRETSPPLEVVLFDSPDPRDPDPRVGARLPAGARWALNPTQDDLAALYQSADVFVAAERKAGWCNTAIEAMACGAAVVCTPSGTTDFARDGRNALVVRLRHPFFLRRAIGRLVADPALRARLGAAGPPSAAPWGWERLAERLLAQAVDARAAAR